MNKEQQNIIWRCIPKESKNEIKQKYKKYIIYAKSILK